MVLLVLLVLLVQAGRFRVRVCTMYAVTTRNKFYIKKHLHLNMLNLSVITLAVSARLLEI